MGVTITSTRPVVGNQLITSHVNGSLITTPTEVQKVIGKGDAVQTTTSYRSGRNAEGMVEDEDFELLSSQDYQDVRKALYSQAKRSKKSRFDNGHGFSTERRQVEDVSIYTSVNKTNPTTEYRYIGPIAPSLGTSARFVVPSAFDGTYYGTRAIAETSPTSPSVSLLTILAELRREGLPAIPGSQIANQYAHYQPGSHDLAGELLNAEFGIDPLVSDAKSAANAVVNSMRILKQYARDSGRQIRRGYSFPLERTITVSPEVAGSAVHFGASSGIRPWVLTNGNAVTSVTGRLLCDTEVVRRIYFRGAYMYHLPITTNTLSSMERSVAQAHHLLGIGITPEVVWNLAPWTWLSDWNFNIGHIMTNISNFSTDSLVLRYGYVMCHTKTRRTYTLVKTQATKSGPEGPFMCSFVTEKKERVRASPYGFAQNPSAYTSRQWAILAALGLSKAPNALP